jgi:DNA-binding transcriptional MerR regulator
MSLAERDTVRTSAAKSPDAFRTISEVSLELDVPQHVLRFWESKFTQIKPMKRGGGRRYYRPEDLELLRGIRQLLYTDGYTIKGVQKVLRENGPRSVAEIGRGLASAIQPAIEAMPPQLTTAAGSPVGGIPIDALAQHLDTAFLPPQHESADVLAMDHPKAELAALRAELVSIRELLVAVDAEQSPA